MKEADGTKGQIVRCLWASFQINCVRVLYIFGVVPDLPRLCVWHQSVERRHNMAQWMYEYYVIFVAVGMGCSLLLIISILWGENLDGNLQTNHRLVTHVRFPQCSASNNCTTPVLVGWHTQLAIRSPGSLHVHQIWSMDRMAAVAELLTEAQPDNWFLCVLSCRCVFSIVILSVMPGSSTHACTK